MDKLKKKGTFLLAAVVVAIAASVASAWEIVRIDYDYTTTGIGTGSGDWSVTIDSGLIASEAAGTPVTFTAAMAVPVFTQVDTLNDGESAPAVAGLNGWINDETDDGDNYIDGEGKGMSWKFYESTDTVTLTTTTAGYETYTWIFYTVLAGNQDDDDTAGEFRWTAGIFDVPAVRDVTDARRVATWWGDVDTPGLNGGQRHSGEDERVCVVGQDEWSENEDNYLDENANGDGIGFSLALRREDNGDVSSLFAKNVTFGGNVFANTAYIAKPGGNLPPFVNAGANQAVWLGKSGTPGQEAVTLDGTITDDGLPVACTKQWTQVANGAPTVTISPNNTDDTSVTITASGTYEFMLTADDTTLTISDTVQIIMGDNSCDASHLSTGNAYDAADLNEDCFINLVDFAMMAINWLECDLDPVSSCPF